jgi:tetratricopeptide (TPR) repeat protein
LRILRNQAMVLYHAHRFDAAIRQYTEALELAPDDAVVRQGLTDIYAHTGSPQRGADKSALARKDLTRLSERLKRNEYVPAAQFARAYIRLDDKEETFHWLEKARDERNALSLLIATDPAYDGLQSIARFARIVQAMHLRPSASYS